MIYDSIIIGGGPAGLSAGINFIGRGKKALVINAFSNLLQKAEMVNNYLGIYNVNGAQMMQTFNDHATQQGLEILNKKVSNIMPSGNTFYLNVDGDILQSKTVVIACGVAKSKPILGEDAFLGKGVSYCATCDGMLYKNKKVAVFGLNSESENDAIFLKNVGADVTFISVKQPSNIKQHEIKYISSTVTEIKGDKTVNEILLANGDSLNVDGIFILRNAIAPTALYQGLEMQDGYITVDRKMQTNVAGLYACGDCTGLPLQVSKAVGEGLIAALSASEYIDNLEN